MHNLRPCPYRQVDDEGTILCDKIKSGDRAVSPNICRACPVAAINCSHLRAALDHQARPPLTVRYGNGKTEIWDAVAPAITLQRAACAAKVTPIHSPRDCAGCPIRQPLVAAEAIAVVASNDVGRRTNVPRGTRRVPAPIAQPALGVAAAPAPPVAEARSSIVAQKIIQLQEWLTGHKTKSAEDAETNAVMPIALGAAPASTALSTGSRTRVAEEKRVGWTD